MSFNDICAASGSKADTAFHVQHGHCTVLARLGQHRLIEVERRVPDVEPNTDDLPVGIEPHEVLSSETIWTQVLVVSEATLEFAARRN